MKGRNISFLAIFVVLLAWGPGVYAGCNNAQLAGTWDVVFSDGNSCRLVLDKGGEVLTLPDRSLSTCFDPFRGATAPESGSYEVDQNCALTFNLLVEDLNIEMYGRLTPSHQIGAGFYVAFVPEVYAAKGSFNIMPVK